MDDIQFGDVQEAIPEKQLRPDRNAHYVVVPYEEPAAGELPIFIDLDVLLDMEAHAASDKTVELGGVMLGGQFHDEDGAPFVVVTDTLRAKHYESTKGSFKFTHDTWSEINRQRNEYPPELQMVGWYHTHPDWGVFLSGMDMFICDNFFNRPLDVAYVIDPCRQDRACFMWTGNPRERVRRTRGFYVMASRYRAAELQYSVAQLLAGESPMPSDQRSGFPGMMAPVVNVTPPPPPPPHQNTLFIVMLTIQVCLLAIIAWRTLVDAATVKTLAADIQSLKQEHDEQAEESARRKVLSAVLSEIKGEKVDFEKAVAAEQERANLRSQLKVQEIATSKLLDERDNLTATQKSLKSTLEELKADRTELKQQVASLTKTIKELEKDQEPAAGWLGVSPWYWAGGAVVLVVALGGAAAIALQRNENEGDPTRAPSQPSDSIAPPGEGPAQS